jgi:hypothetical protein
MTHFAEIINGIVVKVIVAEQDFIDKLPNSNEWVQTSYNTHGGINERTGIPIRKNYAGIGYTYDSVRDAFYTQKPYDSWILNEETCIWDSPIPMPTDDNLYEWNEELQTWDIYNI